MYCLPMCTSLHAASPSATGIVACQHGHARPLCAPPLSQERRARARPGFPRALRLALAPVAWRMAPASAWQGAPPTFRDPMPPPGRRRRRTEQHARFSQSERFCQSRRKPGQQSDTRCNESVNTHVFCLADGPLPSRNDAGSSWFTFLVVPPRGVLRPTTKVVSRHCAGSGVGFESKAECDPPSSGPGSRTTRHASDTTPNSAAARRESLETTVRSEKTSLPFGRAT